MNNPDRKANLAADALVIPKDAVEEFLRKTSD